MNIVQSTTRSDVFSIVARGDQRDEHYRIVALELGGDDHVTKPLTRGSC
jgi:DNA-binding response OmpR family regulator